MKVHNLCLKARYKACFSSERQLLPLGLSFGVQVGSVAQRAASSRLLTSSVVAFFPDLYECEVVD